jgi:hypothetical protein
MFQVEIFEYTVKNNDVCNVSSNILDKNNSNSLDNNNMHSVVSLENKFTKIKTLKNDLISRYIDSIKDECI